MEEQATRQTKPSDFRDVPRRGCKARLRRLRLRAAGVQGQMAGPSIAPARAEERRRYFEVNAHTPFQLAAGGLARSSDTRARNTRDGPSSGASSSAAVNAASASGHAWRR